MINDIYIKGYALYREKQVKRLTAMIYEVEGKKETHTVLLNKSKVSCTCDFFSIHGATTPRICSHIIAAILQKVKA